MIEMYEGPPGSFKTYSIVERTIGILLKGGTVSTNLPLKPDAIANYLLKHHSFQLGEKQIILLTSEQVSRFPEYTPRGTTECPSMIIIDEAGRYFNARDWAKVQRSLLDFLALSRHEMNDVIFSDQSAENVDKQFRRLLQYRWRCRDMQKFVLPLFGCACPLPLYRVGMIDAVSGYEMDAVYRVKRKEIYALYDSWSRNTCTLKRLDFEVTKHKGQLKKNCQER